MVAFDRAEFSARVARQPRVPNRIYVPGAHALADFEAGRHLYIAARGHTLGHQYDCFLSGEGRRGFGLTFGWDSALDLAPRHQIALHQHLQKSYELSCVVTQLAIFRRWNQFDLVTRGVNVPLAPGCHGAPQREEPALPRGVKHRLVLLILNGAHPVHPAHVMYAVHVGFPSRRAVTLATPTIASRVTNAASASTLSFSVPAGRSGSTRYRNSAVLSQTRTSTSSPRSTPNSRNTPRGSITERERYGADLYQTGGRPSTGHG